MYRQQKEREHFSVDSSMMSTTMKPANCRLHFIWPEITGFHMKNIYVYLRNVQEIGGPPTKVWATSDNVALCRFHFRSHSLLYSCRWHHFTSFITIMTRLTGDSASAEGPELATGQAPLHAHTLALFKWTRPAQIRQEFDQSLKFL